MTITLERRLASFRSTHPSPLIDPSVRRRAAAVGAERLAAELDGELVMTTAGTFVRVEGRGDVIDLDRARLARLPGQPPADVPLVCLDTETTGLATAAGTLAFLVGLGWWSGARFRQVQLLLPDHADEPALLAELRRYIPAHGWLVTYNGRGFDWPLLVTRYRMARADPPGHAGHLDLLPLVRRIFRHRLPDARLQTAEAGLLGVTRHGDVPGWQIPARYLQFLRDGEPARLLEVIRHNDEDVRSLARLLAHVDTRLADRDVRVQAHPGDLAGLARAFIGVGRHAEALECLDAALAPRPVSGPPSVEPRRVRDDDAWWSPRRRPDFGGRPIPGSAGWWAGAQPDRLDSGWSPTRLLAERARLLRRLGRHGEAERAWLGVADAGGMVGALAWVEIAKVREHRARDPEAALAATHAALRFAERSRFLGRPAIRLERDLVRRAARLRRVCTSGRSLAEGRPVRIAEIA